MRSLSCLLTVLAAIFVTLASATVVAKTQEEPAVPQRSIGKQPQIRFKPETQTYSMELSILSYNVAGLPWPFLKGRAAPLKAIGDELGALREQGRAPDIVLIQEGFRNSTDLMVKAAGYPNWVRGPLKSDEADESQSHVPRSFKKKRNILKGELTGRIMNSGLYVLSEWPIEEKVTEPFYRGECAGFDCGANKGILWVTITIPGLPGHVQLLTTHLNSRGSSGVPKERSLRAHNMQFLHITKFLDSMWNEDHPFIFGGDLNVKNAQDRQTFMEQQEFEHAGAGGDNREAELALFYCEAEPSCNNNIPLDDEKLGVEKQDWQGFSSGKRVSVEPLLIDRLFHQPNEQGFSIRGRNTLSDHDGLLVRYRLSWKGVP